MKANSWTDLPAYLATRSQQSITGCRNWTAGKDWDGYGLLGIKQISIRAHRAAWELHHQESIPAGLIVRHDCDNSSCINPLHLRLGTPAENNADRERRGRSSNRRGQLCPTAKLTWPLVEEIRRLVAAGQSHAAIAPAFGVSRRAISKIAHNDTWQIAAVVN